MFDEAFYEEKYEMTFKKVYDMLQWNKNYKPGYTMADLEAFRDSQYFYDGVNMLGRSELKHVVINATIAASEVLLEEWRREMNEGLQSQVPVGKQR